MGVQFAQFCLTALLH